MVFITFLVNFNKAWHWKVKIKHSSTETDQDDIVLAKKKPHLDVSSDDSEDLGNNF